jgi:hypothetical protein
VKRGTLGLSFAGRFHVRDRRHKTKLPRRPKEFRGSGGHRGMSICVRLATKRRFEEVVAARFADSLPGAVPS